MDEFGRFLKEERQSRGLSLDDMAARTRIKKNYLEAMEEGFFERLPGETYQRAFVRLYARELGLDVEDALGRFQAAAAPPATAVTSLPGQPSGAWLYVWVAFLLVAVLIAGVLGGRYASHRMALMSRTDVALTEEFADMPKDDEPEPEIDLDVSYFGWYD